MRGVLELELDRTCYAGLHRGRVRECGLLQEKVRSMG